MYFSSSVSMSKCYGQGNCHRFRYIHINVIFYFNSASMCLYEVKLFSFHISVMFSAVHSCAALSHGHPRSAVFGQHDAAVPQTLLSAKPAVWKWSLLGLDLQRPVSFSTAVLAASVRCQEWYYLEEWQRGGLPCSGEHGLYGNTH